MSDRMKVSSPIQSYMKSMPIFLQTHQGYLDQMKKLGSQSPGAVGDFEDRLGKLKTLYEKVLADPHKLDEKQSEALTSSMSEVKSSAVAAWKSFRTTDAAPSAPAKE